VEEIAAFAQTEISTTDLAANILQSMLGNAERAFYTPCYRSKTGGVRLPLDPVGPLIIADWSALRLWTLDWLKARNGLALLLGLGYLLWVCLFVFLLPRESRLHGFRGFDTSGTDQLSRQVGKLSTQRIVGLLVQFYAIARLLGKAQSGDCVEASGMLLKRSFEDASLLWCRVQLYHHRAIHAKTISYILRIVNRHSFPCAQAPRKERLSFRPIEWGGFQAILVMIH